MPHTLTEFGAFYLENPSQARHLFVSDKFKGLDFMKDQVQRTAIYEDFLKEVLTSGIGSLCCCYGVKEAGAAYSTGQDAVIYRGGAAAGWH